MAAIFILSILINRSYFQLYALKPGIYICVFSRCDRKRGYGDHLDFFNFNKSSLFSKNRLKPGIGIGFRSLPIYYHWHCPFLCATENEAVMVF